MVEEEKEVGRREEGGLVLRRGTPGTQLAYSLEMPLALALALPLPRAAGPGLGLLGCC